MLHSSSCESALPNTAAELGYDRLIVRWLYTLFVALAIGTSSFGTLTALRAKLMLSSLPAASVLDVYISLTDKRLFARYLYPFNAIKFAIYCLGAAVILLIEAKYGIEECLISAFVLITLCWAWQREDRHQYEAKRDHGQVHGSDRATAPSLDDESPREG